MEDKKIVCPNCGNPSCCKDDTYCFNCGAALKNYCVNENCVMNTGDEFLELPPYMCYCPECGEETFFMKEGYIVPQVFDEEQAYRNSDSSSTLC